MTEELGQAIDAYWAVWQRLTAARANRAFFQNLRPTAVGWKTTDLADFDRRFALLREQCDQVHLVWLNERWIAAMQLKSTILPHGIRLIKLMQRRPGSSDTIGLDHLDFYHPDKAQIQTVLKSEKDLKWSDEQNGFCTWTSVWFDGTEAKLRDVTTLNVSIRELEEASKKLLS